MAQIRKSCLYTSQWRIPQLRQNRTRAVLSEMQWRPQWACPLHPHHCCPPTPAAAKDAGDKPKLSHAGGVAGVSRLQHNIASVSVFVRIALWKYKDMRMCT